MDSLDSQPIKNGMVYSRIQKGRRLVWFVTYCIDFFWRFVRWLVCRMNCISCALDRIGRQWGLNALERYLEPFYWLHNLKIQTGQIIDSSRVSNILKSIEERLEETTDRRSKLSLISILTGHFTEREVCYCRIYSNQIVYFEDNTRYWYVSVCRQRS